MIARLPEPAESIVRALRLRQGTWQQAGKIRQLGKAMEEMGMPCQIWQRHAKFGKTKSFYKPVSTDVIVGIEINNTLYGLHGEEGWDALAKTWMDRRKTAGNFDTFEWATPPSLCTDHTILDPRNLLALGKMRAKNQAEALSQSSAPAQDRRPRSRL